jgi:hypothetical protein
VTQVSNVKMPTWRDGLEPALIDLEQIARALPAVAGHLDAHAALAEVLESTRFLLLAYDEAAEPLGCVRSSIERLLAFRERLFAAGPPEALAGLLAITERCGQAVTWAAERLLDRAPSVRAVATRPRILASRGVPQLQTIDHPPLLPTVALPARAVEVVAKPPEKRARPTNLAELREAVAAMARRAEGKREEAKTAAVDANAEPAPVAKGALRLPPPGFAGLARGDGPLSPEAFTEERLRELFEELVGLGVQRRPLDTDRWQSIASIERRLLSTLDALASLGPIGLTKIESFVADFPVKDPWRLWAATLVFGSVRGRDTWLAAERLLRSMALGGPEIGAAFVAAARLVPHPDLVRAARTSLQSPLPAMRAAAIAVLASRREASVEELRVASADVPVVAEIALPYFALTRAPDVRRVVLAQADRGLVPWARAVILAGFSDASDRLGARLEAEGGLVVAPFMGLAARDHDVALVETMAERTGEPTLVEALGWLGSLTSVPALIRWLDESDEAVVAAAANALARITGQRPLVDVDVAPEKIEAPAVAEVAGDKSPRRRLPDPRDKGDSGSPDHVPTLVTDRRVWQALWEKQAPSLTPGVRYRRGVPHNALVVWNELAEGPCSLAERQRLQLELVATTGRWVPFDAEDWVHNQHLALAAWEPLARGASSGRNGVWGVATPKEGYTPRELIK